MVQWLRIHLPVLRTWAPLLVQKESPRCLGEAKPGRHNSWSPQALEPVLCSNRSRGSEDPEHCNRGSSHPATKAQRSQRKIQTNTQIKLKQWSKGVGVSALHPVQGDRCPLQGLPISPVANLSPTLLAHWLILASHHCV